MKVENLCLLQTTEQIENNPVLVRMLTHPNNKPEKVIDVIGRMALPLVEGNAKQYADTIGKNWNYLTYKQQEEAEKFLDDENLKSVARQAAELAFNHLHN